ncbi:MAG: ATP-binding protein [Planctomycetes bacterium]|nr:ATP-binding protein [Planctomycetota bacterium]
MNEEKPQDPASLTTLVGGLAHEIRNPLSTINVNLQLLKEEWLEGKSQREKRAIRKLDVIQSETQRLQEILDDFLRFVRIDELHLKPHDINALLDEIVEFISHEVRLKGIDVVRFYDYNLPKVLIDGKFAKQAFLNILMNARQAIDTSGRIMIRTSPADDGARIEITDTGSGMPREVLDKMFKPYYSTKESGTGLGMPTTRRIIEKHGGTIAVQSDVGHGTSVIVHLRGADPENNKDTGNTDD